MSGSRFFWLQDSTPIGAAVRPASPPSARRGGILAGSLALLLIALLAVWAAPASAQLAHPSVTYKFGPDGTSATQFTNPFSGVAYQQANKRLYVAAERKIHGFSNPSPGVFTPLGAPLPFSIEPSGGGDPIAVDNTTGSSANNLYYSYSFGSEIHGYDEDLNPLAGWPVSDEFHEVCGLAVDNEGNVWAAERSYGLAEFSAAGGAPIRKLNPSLGSICNIAIDQSNNDIYFTPSGKSNVYRLSAASDYTDLTSFPVGTSSGYRLAVDGQHHVLVVGWGANLLTFDTETGRLLETVTGIAGNVYGLAVEEATDTVILNSTSNPPGVEVLDAIEVPAAITEAPTANHEVSGSADPDGAGEITECFFQFGTTASYGSSEECDESTPISSPETVHATLPGLLGETAYHYRLVLKNANGTSYGADQTITPHNVIGMHTEPATNVTRTTAQLNGAFEGTGEDTKYYFEYGTSTSYGSRSPAAPDQKDAGVTAGPTTMYLVVSGLLPETTYHFRVIAENEKGKNIGEDKTLTTPKAVADLATEDASDETKHSAVLHASFTGTGEPHTFFFEWGPTSSYGNSTPVESAGSGTGTVHVATEIKELEIYLPDSVPYHYRVVATNSTGTTLGPDHTFETLPPSLPEIASASVLGATMSGATVGTSINPGGGETVFLVEYGPTAAYGSETALSESIGEDETAHSATAQLEGLSPGTTYHYQVVAFNFAGTVRSADGTFTTVSPPPPPPPPVTPALPTVTPQPVPKPAPKPKKHCKRGQVKRGGKCVKRKRHHKPRHRKHKHRKHPKGHGNG